VLGQRAGQAVVVVGEVVEEHHVQPVRPDLRRAADQAGDPGDRVVRQELTHHLGPDEPGGAGDDDLHLTLRQAGPHQRDRLVEPPVEGGAPRVGRVRPHVPQHVLGSHQSIDHRQLGGHHHGCRRVRMLAPLLGEQRGQRGLEPAPHQAQPRPRDGAVADGPAQLLQLGDRAPLGRRHHPAQQPADGLQRGLPLGAVPDPRQHEVAQPVLFVEDRP
jgi:hypothetical protein